MLSLNIYFLITCVSLVGTVTIYPVAKKNVEVEKHSSMFETFRLPNNTKPETYDISLRTWAHQANRTYTGSVRIGILALQTTTSITLQHRSLVIESIRVSSDTEESINIGDVSYDDIFEFLTIHLATSLTEGNRYFVDVQFIGTLQTYFGSFYLHSFWNSEIGQNIYLASTRFEATGARGAFPCYDEIGLKAKFTIRITHDPSFTAISNMPTIADTPVQNPDGSLTTEFQQTPLMSTHLVGFHISDFDNIYNSSGSVPHRLFGRTNGLNQTLLALTTGVSLLDALADYLGVAYALPKLDSVSIPSFSGSLENFGMITYSEYYMMFDESVDNYNDMIASMHEIAHNLAQQWFGNLVTPEWWSFLWMKEGFANLFQYVAIDLVYPDWNIKDYYVTDILHYVFLYDGHYANARPMTFYVESHLEIEELIYNFNTITHNKGGSVLRMFMLAFGEETFMDGLREYINANMFSSVSEEHLFDALGSAIETETIIPITTNVSAIMSSWTRQAGYPLIYVERNYEERTDLVTLSQRRYYNPTPPFIPASTTYWVPYNYATSSYPASSNSRVTGWIPQGVNSVNITIDLLDADEYFFLDTHGGGLYRIIYDERNYKLISDAMVRNLSQFPVSSRANLLDNVREFAFADRLTFATAMDVLRILENEDNYTTWRPIEYLIDHMDRIFSGHNNYAIWRDFVRSLVERLYESVGVDDIPQEPIQRKRARPSAVHLACNMGSVHCRSDATRRLRQLMLDGQEFHQNIRTTLYCASLRSANSNDFQFIWNQMLSSQQFYMRNQYRQTLGCLTSRLFINQLLRSTLPSTNTENVEYRAYEAYGVFREIYENSILGMELSLEFMSTNALEAFRSYGADFGPFFLVEMVYHIRSNDLVTKYRQLMSFYFEEGLISQELINASEVIISETLSQFEKYAPVINQWLMENFV